ncbi:hypothetical protein EYF80_009003 [Liparis tanakae]|uniref:Uncharacterized protein n=1 Tax=Liparis tanakae TaxID=230148 RepID=A0A4Z2IRX6_9TELE|nr:hypothetical protein EYF80_009003 [Liparis tanakae]
MLDPTTAAEAKRQLAEVADIEERTRSRSGALRTMLEHLTGCKSLGRIELKHPTEDVPKEKPALSSVGTERTPGPPGWFTMRTKDTNRVQINTGTLWNHQNNCFGSAFISVTVLLHNTSVSQGKVTITTETFHLMVAVGRGARLRVAEEHLLVEAPQSVVGGMGVLLDKDVTG